MRDLPVRKIPGFGRVTERCLEGLGVEVRASVFAADGRRVATYTLTVQNSLSWIIGLDSGTYGKIDSDLAETRSRAYLGISDNKVAPGKREERKSVGVERSVLS